MKRALGAVLVLAAACLSVPAQTTNAVPATNAPAAAAPADSVSDAIPAAQVISRAEAALAEYPAPDPSAPDRVETDVRQDMRDKSGELHLFASETGNLLAQNPSLDSLHTFENHGAYFAKFPAGWTQSLADRATAIGKKLDQLAVDRKTWSDTQAALAAANPPASPDLVRRTGDVLARLDAVQAGLTARQNDLIALENEATDEGNLVTDALTRLASARDRAVTALFEADAPPVWSWSALPATPPGGTQSWAAQWAALVAYVKAEPAKFVIHGLLFAVLIGGFFWLRGFARALTAEEPAIAPAARLFEMPVAAGGLLALFATSFLYYPIAPRLLFALVGAVALVPSVVLLRQLIERRLFPVLYALVGFFFLEEIRSVATLSPAAGRAFLLAEILAAVAFLGWLLLSLRHTAPAKAISRPLRVVGALAFGALAVGWVADVLGYTLLANLICVSVQRSATLGLALYAGTRIVEALLFILIRLRPLSRLGMAQRYRTLVLKRSQRVLAWAAGLWWACLTLEMLPSTVPLGARLFGSSMPATPGWLGHYKADHTYVLNVGGKLIFAVLIIWAAFQLSRLARFVLEAEFFPRLRLSAGIPYAISTSLHYTLLVVAFVAATYALGIDMTKLTILVSALGVGVGFGLQNIINNFVSGLILLFERPVKIGDTILTGTDSGTVERIGIRASVLRTPAGTEVIVPNGSLISNNVTNWTLSSQERIILIPLNVPRGPDIPHLAGLLTAAVAANPKVLKDPAPVVVAQTLGANLGLELRAWTRAAEDWTTVRSELVLAVNAVLTRENITLA